MNRAGAIFSVIILMLGMLLVGCGGDKNKQATAPPKIPVKAMKVQQQSVPVVYGFPGQIEGKDEIKVHSKVSGAVTEKYINGGDYVSRGQVIYKIDSRQYETAVESAQADLRKAESNLRRYRTELERNERLYAAEIIPQQTLINSRADVESYEANLEVAEAALRKAQENLEDTLVYSPMDGRAALDDVAVGTYSTAGNTNLVTIGTVDPIYVLYSISETEYLNIVAKAMSYRDNPSRAIPHFTVSITLSNGEEYPYHGDFFEVDRSLVLVVSEDGKSLSKTVELGEKVGSYYIVNSGLSINDNVIVEGLTNLQSGKELEVTQVTPQEMGFSIKSSTNLINES